MDAGDRDQGVRHQESRSSWQGEEEPYHQGRPPGVLAPGRRPSRGLSGEAVDVGFAATAWLSERGAEYGPCRIYRNEPWHFELRSEAVDSGCPPIYPDPTHDPRMQQ
jgi:hypothetical protein